jgi:hypothetical protein
MMTIAEPSRARRALLLTLATFAGACASMPAPGATASAGSTSAAQADTLAAATVPPGFGSLRQDEITVQLEPRDLLVRAMPLDEEIIRLLSPDSYRSLRDIVESRRAELERLASVHQLRERNVWYLSLHGLSAEARFNPRDLGVTSAGREFRPLELLPLTAGFGEHRLLARQTQTALVLFEDGIDLTQPLTVSFGTTRSTSAWGSIVRVLERERAAVRSRTRTP